MAMIYNLYRPTCDVIGRLWDGVNAALVLSFEEDVHLSTSTHVIDGRILSASVLLTPTDVKLRDVVLPSSQNSKCLSFNRLYEYSQY